MSTAVEVYTTSSQAAFIRVRQIIAEDRALSRYGVALVCTDLTAVPIQDGQWLQHSR